MRFLSLIVLLAAAAYATAQPVPVAVPPKQPEKWVEFPATGSPYTSGVPVQFATETPANWIAIDDGLTLFQAPDRKSATVGAKAGGRYRIMAIGPDGVPALMVLTFEGGAAPVPIPPQPQPQPQPPSPAAAVRKVVVVEDTAKAGQWRGDILGSPAVAAYFRQTQLHHRVISIGAGADADDEAKKFIAAAAGKELPWLWLFDATGNQIASRKCPIDGPDGFLAAISPDDQPRKMGNKIPTERKKAFKVFGDAPNVPVIKDRTQWKPVNLAAFLPPVYDQNGRGQCNASATCTAMEAAINMSGLRPVHLSAGDLYSQINDGIDEGSMLEDGLDAAMKNGVATVAMVPYVWDGKNHGRRPEIQAERTKYRVIEAYECPDFESMASAIQQGYFVIVGLMWSNYDKPDRAGWLSSTIQGGPRERGGHALMSYGLELRNGQWGLLCRNSWSPAWGIGGNCIIPESRFTRAIGGFWAVRAVRQNGADFPVTPKLSKLTDAQPFYALAH